MARWEAEQQRDYLKEHGALSSSISRVEEQQATKSWGAKYGGMIGGVGLPLAVALSPFTAGQSLTFWSVAALAGAGTVAGGYAGSKIGGKDIDIETDRTFLKEEAVEAQSKIKEAKKERTEDIWKDAGIAAATAGFFKGGGMEAVKEVSAKTATKVLGEEGAQTLFTNLGWLGTENITEDWAKIIEGTKSEDLIKEIKNPFSKSSWLKGESTYPGYLGSGEGIDFLRESKAMKRKSAYMPKESMFEGLEESFEGLKESAGDWWTTKSKEVSEAPGGFKWGQQQKVAEREALIESRTSELLKYAKEHGVSYEEAETAYGIKDPSQYYGKEFGLLDVPHKPSGQTMRKSRYVGETEIPFETPVNPIAEYSGMSDQDIWSLYQKGEIDDETFDLLLKTGKYSEVGSGVISGLD